MNTQDVLHDLLNWKADSQENSAMKLREFAAKLSGSILPTTGAFPADLTQGVLLSRYSRGTGTIRGGVDGRKYFIMQGKTYNENNQEDGTFEGAYRQKIFTPYDLFDYPDSPLEPFDRPYAASEKEWDPELNPTKLKCAFGNDTIIATGPGLCRIGKYKDTPGFQFWFGVTAFVTDGTGKYQGMFGQWVSLALASFPGNEPPKPIEGLSFPCNFVHAINLVKQGALIGP